MSDVLGSEVTCSIAGTSVICDTNATKDSFNPNYTALVRATGSTNALAGYYPGLADGRFTLMTDLYPDVLLDLMAAAGIPGSVGIITDPGAQAVLLGFGASGGLSLSAKVDGWEVSVQQGQIPTLRLDMLAIGPPTEAAAPAAPTLQEPFFALDVDPCTLIATPSSVDVTGFTITGKKTNALKRPLNHSNWPSNIKQAMAEVTVSYTLYNVGPDERAAWIVALNGCPTGVTMVFPFTQQCGGSPAGFTFTVPGCFHSGPRNPGGGPTDFITEQFEAKSTLGRMFAAAA